MNIIATKSTKFTNFLTIIFIIGIIVFEILVLKKFGKVEIIIGLNGLFFSIIMFFVSRGSFANVMLFLYFASLLLLNNKIHYEFKYELILASPLALLLFYSLLNYILSLQSQTRKEVLSKPVLIFVLYFFIMALYGKFQNFNSQFILYESFHFLLFLSIYLILYNLKERADYFFIFSILLIFYLVISLEYIFLGYLISRVRFVTFQSGFSSIFAGLLLSFFLFRKNVYERMLLISGIVIILLGIFSTLTRSLWVTALITFGGVYFAYIIAENKLTRSKIIILIVISILITASLMFAIKNMKPAETIKDNTRSVEQRIESIQNPTEDHSFLMRVELGWYAIQKFLQRPIFGWGLGDFLRYQFLGNPNLKNNYIDNSWLYFLWKGGIIGLSLFVFILYRIIKVSIFILKNSKNKTVKSIVAGIFGGFVGLVALALLSPLFIKYRTNVLIAFFLAYLEFEYNKLKLKQNLN